MAKTVSPTGLGEGMSLMEHLIELRSRLMKCAFAVAIGASLGWFFFDPVIELLKQPLEETAGKQVSSDFLSTEPLEIFLLRIKMSAYLGIMLAMPFLLWQLWKFISPGLYENERKYATAFVASASTLFAMGAAIAYYTLPEALGFLQSMGGDDVVFQYSAEKYVMLIVYMMVAFGVGFQFPIVVVFLQLIGIVTPKQLSQFRRFAIVIIFVVAAVITPSADPISLLALAIPMCLFYEISILLGRLFARRKLRAGAGA